MCTVQSTGTVIVWSPVEPPLKLRPPFVLVAAATRVMATVFVAGSYDTYLLTAVESANPVGAVITEAVRRVSDRLIMTRASSHDVRGWPRRSLLTGADTRNGRVRRSRVSLFR
jgi:hypothetical protein